MSNVDAPASGSENSSSVNTPAPIMTPVSNGSPDSSGDMTGSQFTIAAVSSSEAADDLEMCPEPPDAAFPIPFVFLPPPSTAPVPPPTLFDALSNIVTFRFNVASIQILNSDAANADNSFGVALTGVGRWFNAFSVLIPNWSYADSSDPLTAAKPGENGGTEIGVADPGEAGTGGGHYVAPLGPGPDGVADPGEGAGSGGGYVRPIGTGSPDGPADPGENAGGGGGYVRPIGTGTPDGPADPGESGGGGGGSGAGGGGGGGGGGGEVGGGLEGGHGGGPVKAE